MRILACRSPSACRMAARLSRSARICFSMASLMVSGGSIALISTRFTPDSPLAGRFVQHNAQPSVDFLTRGECLLQIHAADDVAQGGDGELVDGLEIVRDLVRGGPRVGDLVVQHRVDVDHRLSSVITGFGCDENTSRTSSLVLTDPPTG